MIHLGEFLGKAWRYSGATKLQFWPSANKQGHPLILIFIITDERYLFILRFISWKYDVQSSVTISEVSLIHSYLAK